MTGGIVSLQSFEEGMIVYCRYYGIPTLWSESESCRHRAQYNTGWAEWDFLWLLWDWIKPSSFATYHILLHGFPQFLIFHPWSWQWSFYIPPISSTFQLALSSSMSWWWFSFLFYPFWNVSLFAFQAENQIYKSKAMVEKTRGLKGISILS